MVRMNAVESLTLPLFVNKRNKAMVGWIIAMFASLIYQLSNHIHFFAPTSLPLLALDRAIPFVPQTVWIYVGEYVAIVALYMMSNDDRNVNKFVYAFTALQVAHFLIFMMWPTTYPRAAHALPAELDPATRHLMTFLRQIDTPANCCPSLHVGSIYLASFIFLDEQRQKLPIVLTIATAIAVSTLTTKQHYVIDVVLGLAMAVAIYWIFDSRVRYRAT
jgi:membrane-associated phospholipid phosphatase